MSQIGRKVPIAIGPKVAPRDLATVGAGPVRIVVKTTDEEPFGGRGSDEFSQDLRVTCPICEKRLKNESTVESHVRRVHQRPHRCTSCRASYFSQSALDEHSKTHRSDYYFECSTCHMKYKRVEGLKQHHIRAHSTEAARFACDHCGNRYKLKLDLLLHITRAHTSAVQICRFCGKAVKDVRNHEWRHQKRARKLSFDYACKLCGRKFRTKHKHDNHLLSHKDGYSCEECGVKVSGPRQLGYHKRLKHGPGMTCPVCDKVFMSSSNFYQHVLTHARLRPYKCDVCGEDFTQRSSLLRHRRTHPGPLPPLEAPIPIADLAKNYLKEL